MPLATVPGFICAFRFGEDGTAVQVAEDQLVKLLRQDGTWVWLHLNLADWRCRRWLGDVFELPRGVIEDFADPPVRQNIRDRNGILYGHVADFRREFDSDSTEFAWLHLLQGSRYLITGRVKAVQSAERVRQFVARGGSFPSPDAMLSWLLAGYADSLDAVLHRLTDELELIEDHVLDDRHRGERRRLMLTRRETAQLHRHMRALRRALQTAEHAGISLPAGLAMTAARLANLDQDFDDMERRARFFHDEIDAKLAAETNRQLYILSALTAAFLPPALVAGLFGMNLQGIPFTDTPWGFWGAFGLSLASSGAVILYLRRAGRS